jgi:hypothetical protein
MDLDSAGSLFNSLNVAFVVDRSGFDQSIFHILMEFIPRSYVTVINVSSCSIEDHKLLGVRVNADTAW